MSSSSTAEPPRRLGVVRDACSSVASFLANLLAPSDSDPANDDDDAYLSQQQQQQQQQQQLYAATTSSTTSAAAMLSASVALTAAQITNTNYFCTPAANAVFNSPKALELMRAYDAYVGLHKTRWHGAFLFLLAFLFFGCCTVRGWQYRGEITPSTTVADLAGAAGSSGSGSGGGSTGGGGGGGAGGGMDGMPGGVAGGGGTSGGLPGSAAAAAAAAGGGAAAAGKDGGLRHGLSAAELSGHAGRTRHRYASLPALLRWVLGWSDKAGQMALANVEWWPASNRTPDSADAWGERGLRVGTPNAASLSVARSQPPWSADARPGLIGALGRLIHYVTSFVVTPDPPPYELALRAFFRTRQAMTAGSCNRCHADVIERDVHAELARYQAFLRTNRMRVPLLLYYNRLPVFALLMHFRLMRVRNYQLLNYVSRPDAALRHPETVADDISGDARLHGRELDFELTRLAFVFYIQRLHLRAMRHADAMRLETLHFLRHLSTTVPALRALWVGQDHCKWQGVNCIVVHVPLNELIDEEHPSLVTLLADVYSVCRGSHCEQRRCPRGSCNVHVHSFVKSLFTEAIPAYWAQWDRMDDTAAMDEMIFAKAAPKPPSDVEAAAAAAAAAAQQQQQAGTPLQGGAAAAASASPTRLTSAAGFGGGAATHPDMNPLRADVPAMAHGSPAAAAAARTTRLASMTERTVWTEQQFAYDHPDLTLAEPALIIDIDVEAWMTKTLSPVTGDPVTLKDEDGVYRHDVERPLVEDLLPMQRKLLRTMAEAAPRGVRIGKQRATPKSRLTIPFTFVSLDLSQAGLRGYLPDYYDTASSYDVADAAAPAAATTARGSAGGKRTANGGVKTGGPDSGSLAEVDVDEDELAPGRGGAGARGRRPEVSIQKPRSDVYWGKLSRQRMLESRNLSYGFRSKRTVATVSSIAGDIRRVLRRVEKIGQRNNHEDLAAYFSEITAMAQFQNEKWSPYRWPEAMIAVTSAVVQSGRQRLYPILESNAFAAAQFPTPVRNIDHNVEAFGQINPRLVAVLSIDVTGNPQLAHTFPRTWMSLPYLQSVRTFGSSILAAPLRIRSRVYNQSYHCPPGSGIDVLSPYMEDGYRSRQLVMADAARDRTVITASTLTDGGSVTTVQTSLHDRDYVGSVLVPPFKKIDKFLPLDARDGSLDTADPLPDFEDLYRRVDNSFSAGFSRGLWSSLTEPLRTQQ